MENLELQKVANEVRKDIVTALHAAKAGHPGGSLSAADLFTYLYFEEMNIDPKDPKKADRDRFVLSKGHTAPGLYSVLAERGYFPKEDLVTLRHLGSYLQGHPDMKHIPGVDMSSGSLGQGISAAVGMALSAKSSQHWCVAPSSPTEIPPWVAPILTFSFGYPTELRTCSKARPAANIAKVLAKGTFPVVAIPAAIPIMLHSAIPQSM